MDLELVQSALNVLQAAVNRSDLDPQDVILLRRASMEWGESVPIEDLAREVVERYLQESKDKARTAARP